MRWPTIPLVLLILTAPAPSTASCDYSRGIAPDGDETLFDGYFLGGDECFYDPAHTDAQSVPAFSHPSLRSERRRIYYVNGASATAAREAAKLRELATTHQLAVVGIYFSSTGRADALVNVNPNQSRSRAVDTLTKLIVQHLEKREIIQIRSGSAGTLVVADALQNVDALAKARTPDRSSARRWLELVRFESHGSIARDYPDGPQYVHYVNVRDPVPNTAGVASPGAHPGAHAMMAYFSDARSPIEAQLDVLPIPLQVFLSAHGFSVYNAYRRPFEDVYNTARSTSLSLGRVWLNRLAPRTGF